MPFDFDDPNPLDNAIVSQYPANERASRLNLTNWAGVEHTEANGRHNFGVGSTAARDAITDWNVGSFWLNTDATPARLQRVISLGPVVWENVRSLPIPVTGQLLRGNTAVAEKMEWADVIPPGSVTDWFQAAAPTGWTQVVTQNDRALRVVSGAGGGVGGATAFSAAWPAHLHAPGTLAVANHTHTVPRDGWGTGGAALDGRLLVEIGGASGQTKAANDVTSGPAAPGLTGSTANAAAFSPQFIDMILAQKV